MNFFRRIKKLVSCLSIFAIISLQVAPVQAAMVSNGDLLKQAQHDISVGQIVTMLDREEIQKKLTSMGVDPFAAKIRVSQMNDSELAELTQSLEQLPAGSGVLGTLLIVFIFLVITDMLGATDIFPFVKNINR